MITLLGVFILFLRSKIKLYSKVALLPALALLLAIFHSVSFGAGDRTGTVTTPFSAPSGVSMRTPFAVFTILVDVVIAAGTIHWLLNRRKG